MVTPVRGVVVIGMLLLWCSWNGLATSNAQMPSLLSSSEKEMRESRKLVLRRSRRPVQPRDPSPSRQCEVPDGVDGVQVYLDEDSCNSFYKCENGTLTHESCENGLLFDLDMAVTDSVHNYCVYNWKVDCGGRPRDDTRISSPGCEYRFGIFSISEGCQQSYYQCAFGQPTEMPCENDNVNIPKKLLLSYRAATHTCDWPDLLVDIGCDPEQMFGFQCPRNEDLVGTRNEMFSPFPRFSVEGSPQTYLICVDGLPRLQSCGSLDAWDPDTLSCRRRGRPF